MSRFGYQKLKHLTVYFVEIVFSSVLICCFLEKLQPSTNYYEVVEKFFLSYGAYQLLVFVILSTLDDIKKDSTLLMISLLKLCLIYKETENENLKVAIFQQIDFQTNAIVMNDSETVAKLDYIKCNLDSLDTSTIQFELLMKEHDLEYYQLQWRLSFFLRFLK